MDQELYGIVEFLIERAKTAICERKFKPKGYFIMRYPGKPKLVYAPIDISIVMVPLFWQWIPNLIEDTWKERKSTNDPGVELVAVCTICSAHYKPEPERLCQFPDKIGSNCLATTVNTCNAAFSYITYGSTNPQSSNDFGANEPNNGGFTPIGKALYPKNA